MSLGDNPARSPTQEEFAITLLDSFRAQVLSHGGFGQMQALNRVLESFMSFPPFANPDDYIDTYVDILFSLYEIYRITQATSLIYSTAHIFIYRKLLSYFIWKITNIRLMPFRQFFLPIRPSDDPDPECLPRGMQMTRKPIPFNCLLLDSEMTRRLVRYGMPVILVPPNSYHQLSEFLEEYAKSFIPIKFNEVQWDRRIFNNYPDYQKQRLYLVMMATNFMVQKPDPEIIEKDEESLRCLKFLFKSMKVPYMAVSEISRFLNLLVKDSSNKERQIEEFCKEFLEEFPKSVAPLAPRSLKHLSRCRVRESLSEVKKLPLGVWDLDIPKSLKNYLLLQNTEYDYYPKYVMTYFTRKCSFPEHTPAKRRKTTN